jgi:pyruvate dehydrogenase E1 component alpha subunit
MNKEQLLDLYYQMVLIRRVEERGAELYQAGKIGGFMHLYIGQEAVSTGLIAAREPRDRVITAYRDHGVALNCGISADKVMAELLGKATGMSKGKGGSMHMADTGKNMWGGHAIVGGHLPVAAGLALGDQYAGNDNITICMFGDGATNIGYFHEALNLAKTWGLRVLWVCENNQYGMGTAVMKVYEAAKHAMDYIRKESQPYFLEVDTYRFRGHSMGDPERYRKAEEVKQWQANDPIGIFNKYLLDKKHATRKQLDEIESRVEEETNKAVEFAESSPEPALDELFTDIYAD